MKQLILRAGLGGLLFLLGGVAHAGAVEIDMTFTKSRGEILVADEFKKIGRSSVNVEDVIRMQKTNRELERTVRQLEEELRMLSRRIEVLEKRR